MAGFLQLFAHLRIALKGVRATEERALDVELIEKSLKSPDPGATAVLENGLNTEVAVGRIHRVENLSQPLVAIISGRVRVFGSFLIVQHKAERDASPVGPLDLGNMSAVAHVVTLRSGNVSVH
jgi:hypothetical protein